MNRLRPILLVFTAVAALSVAYPAKANLITNGGFETGDFTGWTTSGPTTVTGTSNGIAPHSGNFQANLGGGVSTGSITQTLATTPGQSYAIDLWYATTGSGVNNAFTIMWGGVSIFQNVNDTPPVHGAYVH